MLKNDFSYSCPSNVMAVSYVDAAASNFLNTVTY